MREVAASVGISPRRPRCLIFESVCSFCRMWAYTPNWRELALEDLITLLGNATPVGKPRRR